MGLFMAANDDLVHGWVSTDCGRGTSDILWSCLATILLCVWTVIHLPIPKYRGNSPLSLRQWNVRSGIGTALISVIAPEFLTISALVDLAVAWQGKKSIKRLTQIDWTLTHQFFLDMGGVCIKSPSGRYLQLQTTEVISAMKASSDTSKSTTIHSCWISELQNLTGDQIKDLAKSDTLTKLIACGQALWLVTQVVSRLCQHQALTLLEVSTCAYVACALISYAAWWKKPQACKSPIIITCSNEAISEIVSGDYERPYYESKTWKELVWAGRHWLQCPGFESDLVSEVLTGLLGVCPTLFGAIHVASWNITLPSDVELWLWRASSIYCLTAGFMSFVMVVLLSDVTIVPSLVENIFFGLFLFVIPSIYVLVRIYMIVEVFLSLRALPPSAFESVQWSSFIPHI